MKMRDFIRKNRKEIDEVIEQELGHTPFRRNDDERELWVRNNEPLYRWAKREGVKSP